MKRSRSSRKRGSEIETVWSLVNVYLIPHWRRLLQTEIFPQKAS